MRMLRCLLTLIVTLGWLASAARPASAQIRSAQTAPQPAAQDPLPQAPSEGGTMFLPLLRNHVDPNYRWETPGSLTFHPAPTNTDDIFLRIDRQGRIHVFWESANGGQQTIYHTHQIGAGWSDPYAVSQSAGLSELLFPPYLDGEGKLHLLWSNDLGEAEHMRYRLVYAAFANDAWGQEEVVVSKAIPFTDWRGKVHGDLTGAVVVTYQEWSMFAPNLYQTVRTSSGWSAAVPFNPQFNVTKVLPDNTGGLHLYSFQQPDLIVYSYYRNGDLIVQYRFVGGDFAGKTTLLDGLNNLHFFWTGEVVAATSAVRGLNHQCLRKNEVMEIKRVLSGNSTVQGEAQVASDELGRLLVGWKDADYPVVWLAMMDGCNVVSISAIALTNMDKETMELEAMALSRSPNRACVLVRDGLSAQAEVHCAKMSR